MPVGGQPGNRNAARGTMMRDALERALASGKGGVMGQLVEVAHALINKAKGGDIKAIQEIFDRIDGKVTQPLQVDNVGPTLTDEERAARVAALLDLARERGAGAADRGTSVDGPVGSSDTRTTH